MKTFTVRIEGTSPLLQHRFGEEAEGESGKASRNITIVRGSPREEADKVAYRSKDGHFYIPGTWIFGTLCAAGGNHKMKGSRKSARFVVPAAVRVGEIEIPVRNGDGESLAKDFEVDSRPVTIPATKGRIMRHRPRFDCWSASFSLVVNDSILPEDFVHQLLTEAGAQQGIGDYRPEKRGPFGTFRVTLWEPLKEANQ
jgi:hypothetical protein